ncbi:MAG: PleD family two-component system response regulator [Acetobacteraceae bacterium]|nr:PleD family two-component system response regulator [Acetobacteraceae bacterium]
MTARILVVDDVPANVRLLETRLAAEYYQVASAQDGVEAIRAAHSYQPDLIFLDVMMPNMDGYEACRRLKADQETLHIPVVMVTALTEPSERLLGLEAGADDFLTKPVELDTLLARTRSLVRLKRMLDELRARGETARALGVAGESPIVTSIAGARALVVDDDDESAQDIQDALSREGVIPGRASSEAEALALADAVPFDLIVLSVSLKNDDPLRLASRLRAADSTHDIPLLLVAEREQRERILRGFDLGANDWLLRPMDDNELRARSRNLIKRKFYQDRLRADVGSALEMALTDPLTGFYNQRYLMRHLRGLLVSNQGGGIAVMMIDVDHFKSINDQFGHPVGDQALKAIAEVLRSRTRVFDTVARYGGEEFVVVMPGASLEEMEAAGERLRAAVDELVFSPLPGVQIHMTVSVGLAFCEAINIAPEVLIKAADQAMYQAKNTGRNRVAQAPTIPA